MFDIEHPNIKCLNNQCDFLEEFMIELHDGKFHNAHKCSLTIQDRVKKCPIHLKDLERLDIADYHKLWKHQTIKYDNDMEEYRKQNKHLRKNIEKNNERITYLEKNLKEKNDKLNEWDYTHQRYNRFHQRILDDTKSLVALWHDRDEYRRYVESLRRMVQEVNKEVK